MPIWYLLYSGSSEDGRGYPQYTGRTLSKEVAYKHYLEVSKSPYSFGRVIIISDDREELANSKTWETVND